MQHTVFCVENVKTMVMSDKSIGSERHCHRFSTNSVSELKFKCLFTIMDIDDVADDI